MSLSIRDVDRRHIDTCGNMGSVISEGSLSIRHLNATESLSCKAGHKSVTSLVFS
jgi:hypothetical protein